MSKRWVLIFEVTKVVVPSLIAGVSVVMVAIVNQRVIVLHEIANSRFTQLLESNKASSRAEGVEAGRAERDRPPQPPKKGNP